MAYELWNQTSANIVGAFDTEDAALAAVREMTKQDRATASEWALAVEDEQGETEPIAAGDDLIRRAFAVVEA